MTPPAPTPRAVCLCAVTRFVPARFVFARVVLALSVPARFVLASFCVVLRRSASFVVASFAGFQVSAVSRTRPFAIIRSMSLFTPAAVTAGPAPGPVMTSGFV